MGRRRVARGCSGPQSVPRLRRVPAATRAACSLGSPAARLPRSRPCGPARLASPGGDAHPLLLRGGSARPARGRVARRGAAGRSTSTRCAGRRRRRAASSTASASTGSTSSATRVPGSATTSREYLAFFVRAGWAVARAHRRRRYALVQVHTLPDFLVVRRRCRSGSPACPVILDLHEAMPEFFRDAASRGRRARSSTARLVLQERLSIARREPRPHGQRRPAATGSSRSASGRTRSRSSQQPVARPVRPGRPRRPAPFMADGVLRLVYAGRAHARSTSSTWRSTRSPGSCAPRPGSHVALDVYGRGDTEPALARPGRGGWASPTRSRSTAGSRSRRCPAALAAATSASPRPAATDVHRLQPLDQDLRVRARWASRSWRRACRSSSGPSRRARSRPYDAGDAGLAWRRRSCGIVDDPLEREARVGGRTAASVRQRSWAASVGCSR